MEIMITIVLVVTGLIVLMRMMSIGIFADSDLEYRLTALNLANEKLEELKDNGYSHADLDTGTHTESAVSGFDFVEQRQWTVDYVDANLVSTTVDSGLKDVEVTVQWSAQKGSTESVVVETLIADY